MINGGDIADMMMEGGQFKKKHTVHVTFSVMGCDPDTCNDPIHFYEEASDGDSIPQR